MWNGVKLVFSFVYESNWWADDVRYVISMVLGFGHSNEFDVNYCFECVNNYEFGNGFQTV